MGRYSFLWAPGSLSCCCVLVSSPTNKPAFLKGSVLDCILQRQAELQRTGENQGGKEGENCWFKPASCLGWEVGVGYYYHPHYRDEETQSDLSEVKYSVSGRAGILSQAAWLHSLFKESVTLYCLDPFLCCQGVNPPDTLLTLLSLSFLQICSSESESGPEKAAWEGEKSETLTQRAERHRERIPVHVICASHSHTA